MISVTQPVAGCDRSCIVDRANWAVSARWHPRPDCGADKLVVKVDSFDADGISSVDVSIWAGPVRSGGEAGRARHQREDTMTHYLLSVHSVEGEVREPMTDEEMAQSHKQLGVLEQEMKVGWRLGRLRPPARTRHGHRRADGRRRGGDHRRPVRGVQGTPRRLLHHPGRGPRWRARLGVEGHRCHQGADRGASVRGIRGLSVADGDAATRLESAEVGRIFREESGRSLAALIRAFGDIDVAEDAVQEAFAVALGRWPRDGVPPNAGGWITTTARNHAIDRLRRESRGRELLSEVAVLLPGSDDPGNPEVGPVSDDRLRLIFTCCHPALSTQAQMALTLRLLGGLSTRQVASPFLVTEATMARRLVRAKHKIKAARIPYRVPEAHELPDRLRPVLAVVYLVYNAGLAGPAGPGLCAEAIRLARILAGLMPDEPEVAGLLALLLSESRRASRTGADGSL